MRVNFNPDRVLAVGYDFIAQIGGEYQCPIAILFEYLQRGRDKRRVVNTDFQFFRGREQKILIALLA